MGSSSRNREPGFYWVLTDREYPKKWVIAEWYVNDGHGCWMFTGTDNILDEMEVDEVDEKRIEKTYPLIDSIRSINFNGE